MAWKHLLRKRASLTPSEAASKRRFYVFVLCLLFSAVFWLFTKLSQETSATFTRPVVFSSFPNGLLAASQSDSTVAFRLETTGVRLINYYIFSRRDTLAVDADVLPVLHRNEKQYHFITASELLGTLNQNVSAWTSINNIKPDTLFLELVPAIDKLLPVRLDAKISFEQRFRQYGSITVDPDSVMLTGPQSVLDTLEYVKTAVLAPVRLRQTITESVPLIKPVDIGSVYLHREYVDVRVPVAEFTQADIELPVHVVCPEELDTAEIRLFPNKVNVSILVALQDYARLNQQLFEATVNCPQIGESQDGRLEIELETYPAFVDILRIRPPFVEYIILEEN